VTVPGNNPHLFTQAARSYDRANKLTRATGRRPIPKMSDDPYRQAARYAIGSMVGELGPYGSDAPGNPRTGWIS
jgi:hypothetical protein